MRWEASPIEMWNSLEYSLAALGSLSSCKEISFFKKGPEKGLLNNHHKYGVGKLDAKHCACKIHLSHLIRVTAYLACMLDKPDEDGALPSRDVARDLCNRIELDRKGVSLTASVHQLNTLFRKDDLGTDRLSQGLNKYGSGKQGGGKKKGKVSKIFYPPTHLISPS